MLRRDVAFFSTQFLSSRTAEQTVVDGPLRRRFVQMYELSCVTTTSVRRLPFHDSFQFLDGDRLDNEIDVSPNVFDRRNH